MRSSIAEITNEIRSVVRGIAIANPPVGTVPGEAGTPRHHRTGGPIGQRGREGDWPGGQAALGWARVAWNRRSISCSETSSLWVAIHQKFPAGSLTPAPRSP